jgi:hypothetical protein
MAKLSDERREALRMLAACGCGYSLSTLAARGFAQEMLRDLARTSCVTVHRTAFGPGTSKVVTLRITETARQAAADN